MSQSLSLSTASADSWNVDMSTAINEELRRHSTTPQTIIHRISRCFLLAAFSLYTEFVVFALICTDVVILLYGLHHTEPNHDRLLWTSMCHGCFLVFFALEVLIRLLGEVQFQPAVARLQRSSTQNMNRGSAGVPLSYRQPGVVEFVCNTTYPVSAFTTWDVFLVACGVLGACLWGLQSGATTLASMLRICRVPWSPTSHVQNIILRPVRVLLSTIGNSLYVACLSITLLLLNMLSFSVLTMSLLQSGIEDKMVDDAIDRFGLQTVNNCQYAFSSLLASMSTLFALSTGDQWHDIAFPIMFFKPWAFAIFFLHAVIASGIIIGLMYGALNHTLQASMLIQAELDEKSRMKARKAVMDEIHAIFEGIDVDSDECLTWQEFAHNRKNNDAFIRMLDALNVQDSEVLLMWDIMDRNRDGTVSRDEFLNFMEHMMFDQGQWARLKTMHGSAQAQYRAEEVSKQVTNLQEEFLGHQRLLKQILEKVTSIENAGAGVREFGEIEVAINDGEGSKEAIEDKPGEDHLSAKELMRSVGAQQVSTYANDDTILFWSGGAFVDKDSDKEFNMSHSCDRCDYFVSHCWNAPVEWHTYYKCNDRLESYGYLKAVELHSCLLGSLVSRKSGFSVDLGKTSKSVAGKTLWVDKCCIPQNDKTVKAACVALLEEFMRFCDGFIVILSWQYFTRLWCVYEWACFLRTHTAASVELGFDAFLKSHPDETLPLYLDSIQKLSVKGSQCFFEGDHAILEAKVFQYYNGEAPEDSFAAFERFAKCTAICLMAKQLVLWRARASISDEEGWLGPFRDLADKLEFKHLANILRRAHPAKWFLQCQGNQEAFVTIVMYWFDNDCVQYLLKERKRAIRKIPKKSNSDELRAISGKTMSMSSQRDEEQGRPEETWQSDHWNAKFNEEEPIMKPSEHTANMQRLRVGHITRPLTKSGSEAKMLANQRS